jgi:hypothetical protein
MQYNHYPTMGYNDIAEKMQDQGTMDNANNYFKENHPDMEPMQAPPEFEKGTVGKMAGEGALKLGIQGAAIGANPALVAATGGVSIAVGAGVGAAVGAVSGWLKGSKLKKAAESDAAEFKASKAKSEALAKERDYRMNQAQNQAQKQADYMKTLSSGKLR